MQDVNDQICCMVPYRVLQCSKTTKLSVSNWIRRTVECFSVLSDWTNSWMFSVELVECFLRHDWICNDVDFCTEIIGVSHRLSDYVSFLAIFLQRQIDGNLRWYNACVHCWFIGRRVALRLLSCATLRKILWTLQEVSNRVPAVCRCCKDSNTMSRNDLDSRPSTVRYNLL